MPIIQTTYNILIKMMLIYALRFVDIPLQKQYF